MINHSASFHILRLLETPGVGTAKVREIIESANRCNVDLNEILSDIDALKRFLKQPQINEFLTNEKRIIELWNHLSEMNIYTLAITDNEYPDSIRTRLGKKAPPILTILGNKGLLKKDSVGFCGSRKASAKGIETARDCAKQLANAAINVVSGYAAGIDMATHISALSAGGSTTIVLAEGILNFRIKKDISKFIDMEKIVVISEVLPGIPWSIRNAMERNKTICALSRAMILIESGINGGSMAAGKSCLNMGIPLFAPIYEDMPASAIGNQELLKQGAMPLLKSKKLNMANLTNVFKIVRDRQTQIDSTVSMPNKSQGLWQ